MEEKSGEEEYAGYASQQANTIVISVKTHGWTSFRRVILVCIKNMRMTIFAEQNSWCYL